MVWNTRRPRLKNEKHRILRTGWSHNIRNFKLRLVATVFCVVEINVSGNKIPLRLAPWSLPRARELPNGLFPPLLLAFHCRIAERQRGRKGERRKERERERGYTTSGGTFKRFERRANKFAAPPPPPPPHRERERCLPPIFGFRRCQKNYWHRAAPWEGEIHFVYSFLSRPN